MSPSQSIQPIASAEYPATSCGVGDALTLPPFIKSLNKILYIVQVNFRLNFAAMAHLFGLRTTLVNFLAIMEASTIMEEAKKMENQREQFREALIRRVQASGITITDLARRTGVSKPQLDKLMQRRVHATNVEDAAKLARFFGETVEDFLGRTDGAAPSDAVSRIRLLVGQLSLVEQEILEAQIAGLVARRGAGR